MQLLAAILILLAQAPAAAPDSDRVGETKPGGGAWKKLYRADAEKYVFHHGKERKESLQLAAKPIMRWSNDDDWSGDVFIWTHAGRPEVVGCLLSGPGKDDKR